MRIYFYFLFVFALVTQNSAWASLAGADLYTGKPIEIGGGARGLVVIFMSARCPCSNSHVAKVQKLKNDFGGFGFAIVHANRDESIAEAQDYFRRQLPGFAVLQDHDLKLADRFHASRTPHAFVISTTGEVIYRGGVSDSTDGNKARREPLRDALDDLLHDHEIRVADARALGCAISRRERTE